MHSRNKKEFNYLSTSIALYFDPQAFILTQSSFEDEVDAFCYSTAATFKGNDQAFKSYYVHRVLKIDGEYHYVYANEDQAFSGKNKILAHAPERFTPRDNQAFNDAILLRSQETRKITNLDTSLQNIEEQAKRIFLAGKSIALKPANATTLQDSQQKSVNDQVAANLNSQARKDMIRSVLQGAKLQLDAQFESINATEAYLEKTLEDHTRSVRDISLAQRRDFYHQELKATKDNLTKQKEEIQKKINSLQDKENAFSDNVNAAQEKIVNSILNNSIHFKTQLLAAVYQVAYESYDDVIKAQNKEEQRLLFNNQFTGFAEINIFGHLVYCGDHHLQAPIENLGRAVSHLLKSLKPSTNLLSFLSTNKGAKPTQHRNLKDVITRQLTNNAHYVKIDDEQLTFHPSIKQLTEAENSVKKEQTQKLDQASRELKEEVTANSALGRVCAEAKETADKIAKSLEDYARYCRFQITIDAIHNTLTQHQTNLKNLLDTTVSELSNKSATLGENAAEVISMRSFHLAIQNKALAIQALLDEIVQKKNELAIASTTSHDNVQQQSNKVGELLAFYVRKITGKDIDHGQLHSLTGSIHSQYEHEIHALSVELAQHHAQYSDYKRLLSEIEASKKRLKELEDENVESKADEAVTASNKYRTDGLIDHNDLQKKYSEKKSEITNLRDSIKRNMTAAKGDMQNLAPIKNLTYADVPAAVMRLRKQHDAFKSLLTNISKDKTSISTTLNEEKEAIETLVDDSINIIELCGDLVSIIKNKQYWSEQTSLGGTKCWDDQNVKVPEGIAEMQRDIRNFENQHPGNNWKDNPSQAKALLTRLVATATFKLNNDESCCSFNFFSRKFRKHTTNLFYTKMKDLKIDFYLNNTKVEENSASFIYNLKRDLGMRLPQYNEMRRLSAL